LFHYIYFRRSTPDATGVKQNTNTKLQVSQL